MAGQSIIYRPMELKDVTQVHLVERSSFPAPWSRSIFVSEVTLNDNAIYIVAISNDRVVGYAGLWVILDEGHITTLAVDPNFRRLGIGRKLMEELTLRSIKRGIVRMTLEVRVSNHKAQRLYEKLGFVPQGIRKEYYLNDKEDALIMWRELGEDWTNVGN